MQLSRSQVEVGFRAGDGVWGGITVDCFGVASAGWIARHEPCYTYSLTAPAIERVGREANGEKMKRGTQRGVRSRRGSCDGLARSHPHGELLSQVF